MKKCSIGERIDMQISGTGQTPEIDLHKFSRLIFNESMKAIQWRKGPGKIRHLHAK